MNGRGGHIMQLKSPHTLQAPSLHAAALRQSTILFGVWCAQLVLQWLSAVIVESFYFCSPHIQPEKRYLK